MKQKTIHIGNSLKKSGKREIKGEFVEFQNEKFYKINNYHKMADFFMTITSESDHWMFLSSNGSLSAGRNNRDNAVFPYYSVDKIHDSKGITGSQTYMLVEKSDKIYLWEPFSEESEKAYTITRNLYKSIYGNKIIFEEINSDLGLSFRYGWYNTEKFGFVKRSFISNISKEDVKADVLDGIKNILPSGVDYAFQREYSNLLDAYKKNELLKESRIALFLLSSIPIDRAEPSEALKATTVWSCGLSSVSKILISDLQIKNFTDGLPLSDEFDIRANRGSFYINTLLELEKDSEKEWMIIAEVNMDRTKVENLDLFLKSEKNISQQVLDDIQNSTSALVKIVASSDGIQTGNEKLCVARHFSNTLFNIMRGGIFSDNYNIYRNDFNLFVRQSNKSVYDKFKSWIDNQPEKIHYLDLVRLSQLQNNPDIERLCSEYLPLTFSRRHGDPSRPWNMFSIETKNIDGSRKLKYEGNWRDIFQNWEALGLSFPGFIEGMIARFLNASTADGYNPYRITIDGIDWECPDPNDSWSYIGYWGDHQIIYLQKFLELSDKFHPGELDKLLTKEIFVFANVPYRIREYDKIVENPKDTIEFDHALNDEINDAVIKFGSDGRLLRNKEGSIYHVNLIEKILITLMAKLSNFVPEAGIWMNTQRPEWNDANNALVGNGASMVTLYYIRRFLDFWKGKLSSVSISSVFISEEVKIQFDKIFTLFLNNTALLNSNFSDGSRLSFTDSLGRAGSDYRKAIYKNSYSGRKEHLLVNDLREFVNISLAFIDQSIKVNRLKDGLYNAYNLISFSKDGISIRYLYEMLEGQVAVLSSGYLSSEDSLDVLNALKNSTLFREDQYSYLLYPDRQLARFAEKNNITQEQIDKLELPGQLLIDNDVSIITADKKGYYHFNSDFRNAGILGEALTRLKSGKYKKLVEKDERKLLDLYEEIFDHKSFTGRSGTFYGYEGLGSIYWHMVSKLLLATQECFFKAVDEKADIKTVGRLKEHYYEIKAGIGLYKSPEIYGAFPVDAYSHTPSNSGVRQPGMTGQVKEDLISRIGEVGVHIKDGEIYFNTLLINRDELLQEETDFEYYTLDGNKDTVSLKKGQFAFTFNQTPIIYSLGEEPEVTICFSNGEKKTYSGNSISGELSQKIFSRKGEIILVEFHTPFLNYQ